LVLERKGGSSLIVYAAVGSMSEKLKFSMAEFVPARCLT